MEVIEGGEGQGRDGVDASTEVAKNSVDSTDHEPASKGEAGNEEDEDNRELERQQHGDHFVIRKARRGPRDAVGSSPQRRPRRESPLVTSCRW